MAQASDPQFPARRMQRPMADRVNRRGAPFRVLTGGQGPIMSPTGEFDHFAHQGRFRRFRPPLPPHSSGLPIAESTDHEQQIQLHGSPRDYGIIDHMHPQEHKDFTEQDMGATGRLNPLMLRSSDAPIDSAWSILKALPEDSLYTEEVSRTGSGAYGDPMLTPAVVQNRLQTMHPAIRGMMQRRLRYGLTPRQKHMGRIEGYGASNVPYPATPEHVPVIEDVPTIDMPYYPEEGFPYFMGPLGDISIRSGAGALEHLPVDETTLASHTRYGGHRTGGMDNFLDPIEQRGGRYPGGEADRAIREQGRSPLNVFRDVPNMALAEHLGLGLGEVNLNRRPFSWAESFNIGSHLDPGTYPSSMNLSGEPRPRRNNIGYGEGSPYGSGYVFDPEQFGRSIFDYDMRDEL